MRHGHIRGRWCFGKTPMQTFLDAMPMTKEKMIASSRQRTPKPDRSTRHQLSDRVPANTIDYMTVAEFERERMECEVYDFAYWIAVVQHCTDAVF
jgi:hypothetical protein